MAVPDPTRVDRFLAEPTLSECMLRDALGRARTPREAAWALAEQAGDALGLLDCVVYLADGHHTLTQVAAWGYKQAGPRILESAIRLSLDRGIVGACARERAPQLVADTRLDPRYVVDDGHRLSEVAVPILDGERLIGVIDSEHPDADAYRSAHVRALQRLAGLMAERMRQLEY